MWKIHTLQQTKNLLENSKLSCLKFEQIRVDY